MSAPQSFEHFSEEASCRVETVDGWTTVTLIRDDNSTISFSLSCRDMLLLAQAIGQSIAAHYPKEAGDK